MREFAAHSGDALNAEGWGVAHCVDGDVRLMKEPGAARDSACLNFIEQHPIRSHLVAHGHRRTQAGGDIRPPGLQLLCRACEGGRANFDAIRSSAAHAADRCGKPRRTPPPDALLRGG